MSIQIQQPEVNYKLSLDMHVGGQLLKPHFIIHKEGGVAESISVQTKARSSKEIGQPMTFITTPQRLKSGAL